MADLDVIECVAFRPGWEGDLARFLSAIATGGEEAFFRPHAGDEATLRALAQDISADLYYLLVQGRDVLAYGLLRGWDAGYTVPSLGIAVHPAARSIGLGQLMMEYLEMMARLRGAPAVRLRVHKNNKRAVEMYECRGYRMAPDEGDERLIVGIKSFDGAMP